MTHNRPWSLFILSIIGDGLPFIHAASPGLVSSLFSRHVFEPLQFSGFWVWTGEPKGHVCYVRKA